MATILKSVKVHFLKYLSLGPTKILSIVSFYVSFKPRLDAIRLTWTTAYSDLN